MQNLMDLLTAGQVARQLGVSPVRVNQLREEGRLPGARTALGFLYRKEDVARLMSERASRRGSRVTGGGRS